MIKKFEKQVLEAYLNLPVRKLLNHEFELNEDYLAGYVSKFLKGYRFNIEFIPFDKQELDKIENLIQMNIDNNDGKDLYSAYLLTKATCNILNKYKK